MHVLQKHSLSFVKMVTIHIVLSIAAQIIGQFFQIYVTNVFLQGFLDEKVYMDIPQDLYAIIR